MVTAPSPPPNGRTQPPARGRRRLASRATPFLLLALCACSSTAKTSTGRTQRETDSVIGQSKLPGAPVVKKAMTVSDSASRRVAAEDSIAAGQ
jgi:hypothetical protein